ncbi:M15 family metallopeptidase [Streptomyces sp. NPDC005648]|uniref:M15 family metallopeptidase n=1 Tax=Streptomyces sp. NPDC005648 TaxID=3157044 RepID=UPI0033B57176
MKRIPRRLIVVGPAAVLAVITAALCYELPKSSSFSAASPLSVLRRGDHGGLGEADGAVPDGATVFDDSVPGVARLDPGLLKALREAATAAADDGITFYVNSGRRSAAYQNRLLREAIAKYGSAAEAARWVATAATSPHVSGDAVDLGHTDATNWLSGHGAAYGLCRIYRNEPWHYELRAHAIDHGCPRMYADPTQDPRMRQ